MFGFSNKATIIGNIGRDPEIRSTQSGGKIANFSIATSETWTDKATGERKDKTQWHRITVFNERLVEHVEKHVKKGSKIMVEGQIETRKFIDKDGVERETTEIVVGRFKGEVVVLSGRDGEGSNGGGEEPRADAPKVAPKAAAKAKPVADDDDIPF